jgi:parallel beta-helix repeat protein
MDEGKMRWDISKITIFLIFFVFIAVFIESVNIAESCTVVVSPPGVSPCSPSNPEDYYFTTIQGAVDGVMNEGAPSFLWSIIVCPGEYIENVDIPYDLRLNIYGNPSNTIIRSAASNKHVFNISNAPRGIAISGFTITGTIPGQMCGDVLCSGIYVRSSKAGISNSYITGNNAGITYRDTSNINISNNNISLNSRGINLINVTGSTINDNYISNNTEGISLDNVSSNNKIYHNDIIGNTFQVIDNNLCSNSWYDPTLLEGNYWSDYSGIDDGSGTGKHAIAGDGIGDTLIPHPSACYDDYPLLHSLSVSKSGAGSGKVMSSPAGIDCGTDCSENYNYATEVTLTATPDAGSVFAGWSGDPDCSDGVVAMDSVRSCTATFNLQTYTLSVTKAGSGSGAVTSSPAGIDCGTDCSENYNYATEVTLTATPDAGSVFAGWSGDPDCSDGLVTMDSARSCTATFNLQTYTLSLTKAGSGSGTVTSSPAGIDCGTDCSENYSYGTVVTLTATTALGSTFNGWDGCGSTSGNTCTVTMNANKTVKANFIQLGKVEAIDSNGCVGEYTSIATDSSGNSHISYRDCTNGYIKYATNRGVAQGTGNCTNKDWNCENLPDTGINTSIAVDSNNKVHISYVSGSTLKYATNDSGSWIISEPIDSVWSSAPVISMALDSNNKVYISYYHYDSSSPPQYKEHLRLATNASGSWVIEWIDYVGCGSYDYYSISLAIDLNNQVHVVYYLDGPGGYGLKYSGPWGGGIIGDGERPSIAIDSSNRVHISFFSYGSLIYTYYNGTTWQGETMDSGGWYNSIAIDSSDKVHISYQNNGLEYATNKDVQGNGNCPSNTNWNCETVDSNGDVGAYNSTAIDSLDRLHISYYDSTNTDLKYATKNLYREPDITVTPTSRDFNYVRIGNYSDKTVTVRNDGTDDLLIGTVTNPSSPFSKIADNCSGRTLGLSETCSITVRFEPAADTAYTSSFDISSNDPDENPFTVALSGTETILAWQQLPLRTQKQKDAGMLGGEGMQKVWSLSYAPVTVTNPNAQILYLASNTSQVWKSVDGGNTWQMKHAGFLANGAISLAVNPDNEDIVFAAGSLHSPTESNAQADGIYRTQDGGESWSLVRPTPFYNVGDKKGGVNFAFGNSGIIYAGTHKEGLLISTTGGNDIKIDPTSWQTLVTFNQLTNKKILDVKVHPNNPSIIFLATEGGLYKVEVTSTNPPTATLTCLQSVGTCPQCLSDVPRTIAIKPDNPDIIYATIGKYGVYKSTNGGISFSPKNNGLPAGYKATYLAMSPVNPDHLYVSFHLLGGNYPYYTNNGGEDWYQPSVMDKGNLIFPALIESSGGNYWSSIIAAHPTNENTAITDTSGDHLEITTDGGDTWTYSSNGYNGGRAGVGTTSFSWDPNNPDRFAIFLIDYGPVLTEDRGSTFRSLNIPRYGCCRTTPVGALDPNSKVIVTAVGDWSNQVIAVTQDEGLHWTLINNTNDTYKFIAFHPQKPDIVYAGQYKSINKGVTWTKLSKRIVAMFPGNGDIVYAAEMLGTEKSKSKILNIYKSVNGGNTWTDPYKPIKVINIGDTETGEIFVDPLNEDRIYVTELWRGGIFIWDGTRWVQSKNGLTEDRFGSISTRYITIDPNNPNIVYAGKWIAIYGHANGVFRSTDYGNTWENITYALGPEFTPWSMSVNPHNGYVYVGSSHGTWRLPPPYPLAPDNLSATRISSSQLDLLWSDNSDNEDGFYIERKTGAMGTYSRIATVNADVITYSNAGLTPDTTYCYRIKAYNAAGESAYSNEACATATDPTETDTDNDGTPDRVDNCPAISNPDQADSDSNGVGNACDSFVLYVNKVGNGTGTVTSSPAGIDCGGQCSEPYNYGTGVKLTATPDTGSYFAGWSGDPDCSDGEVTTNAIKTCTATFNNLISEWSIKIIDSDGCVGSDSSLDTDSSGKVHISYYDCTNGDLKYATNKGVTPGTGNCINTNFKCETVDSNGDAGSHNSIAVDSSGKVHISYYDATNGDLKYCTNNPAWNCQTLDSNGNVGLVTSISTDSFNNVHISYTDLTNHYVKYTYYDGSTWQGPETVDTFANSPGPVWFKGFTSLDVDSSDMPHISYLSLDGTLKYAYKNGATWQIQSVDSSVDLFTSTSLVLDSSDRPHIAYYNYLCGIDSLPDELRYAYFDGISWQIDIVSYFWPFGRNTSASLALDSSYKPHISYIGNANYLQYANKAGTIWNFETIDINGSPITRSTSIAIDPSDKVHISYYDSTNQDLKYATTISHINTLSVTKDGTCGGTVTSSPAGIDCGTDCSEDYTYETTVILTALPDAGCVFAGWSGDADCLDGIVTMDADKTCTATFESQIPPDAPTALSAATMSSYQINLSWTDNADNEDGFSIERKTGSGGTYNEVATVSSDVTSYSDNGLTPDTTYYYQVKAYNTAGDSAYSNEESAKTFPEVVGSRLLSLNKAGSGIGILTSSPAGINCGTDCSESYTDSPKVTLTATPQFGATFVGWSGDADCSDGSITMDSDKNCIATFNDPQWVAVGNQFSAGDYHTVALKADGTLWTWGLNDKGQLGHSATDTCGTYSCSTSPEQVGLDSTWQSMSAGGKHTVALKSDGTLWAWGDNSMGQLGDGTGVNKFSPVQVGTDDKWISISAGFTYTIGLKADGTLWAWGANWFGQLGDGTGVNKLSPVQVGSDNTWVAINAGGYHTIALKADGTLWAWGDNSQGQLGDGTGSNQPSPVQIGSDKTWVAISAGGYHTIAKKADGTLWAWGWNVYGQLGDGTTTERLSPVQVLGTDTTWDSISAGSYHTIAKKADGTLWAWGANWYGQLGDGTIVDSGYPMQIGNDTTWLSIGTGGYHTIALKADGTLWAWGDDSKGQLGNGPGTMQAMGKNMNAQSETGVSTPVQIGGAENQLVSTAAGDSHSIALKADGTLWAWGDNSKGQLGDGSTTDRFSPVQIGTDDKWVSIAAGGYHSIALKADGTLWAWGDNSEGQLGDGSTTDRLSPVQIGTDNTWVSIAAGDSHSIALKADSTLWAWGANWAGQLGDGSTTDRLSPVQIGADDKWISISAGGYHTIALKADGTLWAWGANWFGQLGDGSTTDRLSPVQIGTDDKWISVSASSTYTIGLKANGTLWAWGDNSEGQLGDGTGVDKLSPVQVGTDNTWVSIATGNFNALGLKADGTLWAWGDNSEGQLGDGTGVDKLSPVQVGTDNTWVSIAAGDSHSIALKADSTLWAWGANWSGQLGNGTTMEGQSPVQITYLPPTANPGGPYSSIEGQAITLDGSGSSGSVMLYEWDIDNDGIYEYSSSSPTQSHTYAQQGTYTIKLRVIDNIGATNEATTTANITDTSPTAAFTGTPVNGIAPLTVNFTNTSTGYDQPLSYQWDFDNNSTVDSTSQNPSYIYTNPGTYSVTLMVTDSDGSTNLLTKINYISVCNLPVRILRVTPVYYSTLQAAYDDPETVNGDTIQSQAVTLIENPNFDLNKSVTIQGGYDCKYNNPPTGKTTLNGNMTIGNGQLTIENFILE